jgi:hypothetical protein
MPRWSAMLLTALVLLIVPSRAHAQPGPARVAPPRATSGTILGRWRIVRASIAPWTRRAKIVSSNVRWIGREIRFDASRVTGPGVLRCDRATYTPTHLDAEGLFQGSLPSPAKDAAARLGLVDTPVEGVSLRCSTGLFELHRPDPNTMLLALDDMIYTLDRSAGAFAPDSSPAGVVQRLLEHHFSTRMEFDSAHVAYIGAWLTGRLRTRIARYFATRASLTEAPAIDGDPFTDSQEHPTRFSVGLGIASGDSATVPVRFTDGRRVQTIVYVLGREQGAWRVDDLRYDSRETLDRWLR